MSGVGVRHGVLNSHDITSLVGEHLTSSRSNTARLVVPTSEAPNAALRSVSTESLRFLWTSLTRWTSLGGEVRCSRDTLSKSNQGTPQKGPRSPPGPLSLESPQVGGIGARWTSVGYGPPEVQPDVGTSYCSPGPSGYRLRSPRVHAQRHRRALSLVTFPADRPSAASRSIGPITGSRSRTFTSFSANSRDHIWIAPYQSRSSECLPSTTQSGLHRVRKVQWSQEPRT